jgi:hypothetical protein
MKRCRPWIDGDMMCTYHRNVPKIAALFLVTTLLFLGCGSRYPDQQYMALRLHSRWDFSGALRRIEVADSAGDDVTEYTIQIGVGIHGVVLSGIRYVGGRFYLATIDGSPIGYGAVHFEPPIPILPPSAKVGEMQTWETVEIHEGNPVQHFRVRVHTTVLEPSPVMAADTTFDHILRVRINYAYEDPSTMPFLAGESEWWFAQDVGIVRYQIGWYPYQDIVSYSRTKY